MNIAEWLLRTAALTPDAPAIFDGTEEVATYSAFGDAAQRMAHGLQKLGLKPGERVALFTPNCPDFLTSLMAIWIAGGVAVPVNAKLHPREVAWILENSGAKLAFCNPEASDNLAKLTPCRCISLADPRLAQMWELEPVPLRPKAREDLAWLFYTSGTTGKPKGVEITHGALADVSLAYLAEVDETQADHCTIYAAPMTHGAGFYAIAHILKGARHIVPKSGRFDPAEVFELAKHHANASMFAAPTMIKRLIDHAKANGQSSEGFKTIIYGGGPMYVADIIEAVEVMGPRFAQIYGQGECPMCITVLPRRLVADRSHKNWRARLGSVGVAQSICALRITADGKVLGPGEIGEIEVRSEAAMLGYWNNPKATMAAFDGDWLKTGDMGALDADGFLTLHDRSKDMVISGGSNVYPREVEEVLLTHAAVEEAAVIGRPHPEWGEEVVAVVVGNVKAPALDTLLKDHLAGFKRPKAYVTCKSLPKNNYGKVLKTELREALAQGQLSPL